MVVVRRKRSDYRSDRVDNRDRLFAAPRQAPGPPPDTGRRLPLAFPVVASVGLLLAVVVVAIAIAAFSILRLSQDQAQLQDQNVPYAVAVSTAALYAKGIANDERGYLISGNREFLEEIEQRLINVRTAFSEAAIAADGERQRRAIAAAHAGFEEWFWVVRSEFKMFQTGDREKAVKTSLGPGRSLRKKYEASLAEAQAAAKTALQLRRNSFASSGWLPILLAVLVVVLGIGFAVTLWLTRTLGSLTAAARGEPHLAPSAQRFRR
jgi:CHASE3 domain sensor protein